MSTIYKRDNISVELNGNIMSLFLGKQCQGRVGYDYKPISEYALDVLDYIISNDLDNILVIGGGAFMVTNMLRRIGVKVDTIEPNMAIIEVASEYFGLKSGANIYIAQAQDIIDKLGKYDCIFLDAYNGKEPVPELYNETFYSKLFEHLNTKGVLISNDTRHGYSKVQYYVKE